MNIKSIRYRYNLTYKHLLQYIAPSQEVPKSAVFVAGNQRSGTNMLMDVLEKSMETDVYHERDPRAFDNYQMRDTTVIKQLHDKSKARVFIIKALCELQDLPELLDEFKPAKLLWMVRHHHDVVNSMMRSFEGFASQLNAIAEDRSAAGWRGLGMSDETHTLVKNYAARGVNDETAAALQWYYRNILLLEQRLGTDARTLVLSYENLVKNPKIEFDKIYRFLDLSYTDKISRNIFATSVSRNRPPDIHPEVAELCHELQLQLDALML